MLTINIIAVGSLKEKYLRDAAAEYQKRISAYAKINIVEIPEEKLSQQPSGKEIEHALCEEGKKISVCAKKSAVVALCIEGKQYSSVEFSSLIEKMSLEGISEISFVIGSSYGLSDNVKNASKLKLSFSKMTLPHQLCRVILLEQVYRALNISANGRYHK